MLYEVITKSPFEHSALETCLRYARQGAAVLLIEDGVYAAARDTAVSRRVEDALKKVSIYALEPDLAARGMSNRVIDGVRLRNNFV